jgi:hypothetical protein
MTTLKELGQCSQYNDWLQAECLRGWGLSPGRDKIFLLSMFSRPVQGHPASYSMSTGDSFPGGEADHKSRTSAVKNT